MIDPLIPLAANGGAPVQTPSIFSPVLTPAIAIWEIKRRAVPAAPAGLRCAGLGA